MSSITSDLNFDRERERQQALNDQANTVLAILAVNPQGIASTLPTNAQKRKDTPIVRGVLDYFPAAIAEVARVSKLGNDQHNPGQEMHWARGKSSDHADCIVRHLMDRGTIDTDGVRHSAKVAWRALALLQEELEKAGAAPGRASRFPDQPERVDVNLKQRHPGEGSR